MADWQEQLDREGRVVFRQPWWRLFALVGVSVVCTAACVWSWVVDGLSWWSTAGLLLFGVGGLALFVPLVVSGVPSLTVTRAGVARSGRREVAFDEIVEILTSREMFGFTWAPRAGESLRLRWERKHATCYASIQVRGIVDGELLAEWILHLAAPSGRIGVEPRYAGLGKAWRILPTDRAEPPASPGQSDDL
jgi:hypothetical protein